ncbi:hypothetical protein CUM72_10630 [Enterococcus durans]|nr:hypothetical protein F6X87_01125 [Enterococcus durans]PQD35754.1 hypothetical protein CUM72_10630 [Enterococcus durans]
MEKNKKGSGVTMYGQPILFLGIGGCLLVGNIFLLLSDYKYNLTSNKRPRSLWLNLFVLFLAIVLLVLGIIYFLMIHQQV